MSLTVIQDGQTTGARQATVLAVKAMTDNLPTDPADQSQIEAAINTAMLSLGGSGVDGAKNVASSENITPETIYQYTTLTVAASQTLGLSGAGRMLIICNDKVTVNGTISVAGKGNVGGALAGAMSVGNPGTTDNSGGLSSGGAGGGGNTFRDGGAGGGSTDTGCGAGGAAGTGSTGTGGSGVKFTEINALNHYLDHELKEFILNTGSGGGSGVDTTVTGKGGNGGGCLVLIAPEITINTGGAILGDGDDGETSGTSNQGGGGGGAGGNILIITNKLTTLGTLTAAGGSGGSVNGDGGAGGVGGAGNLWVVLV